MWQPVWRADRDIPVGTALLIIGVGPGAGVFATVAAAVWLGVDCAGGAGD